MGVRRFSAYSETDVTLTTTAETVVATLTGVSTNQNGQTVGLRGSAKLTTGAGTTALTPRVRRDSLTGAIVGEAVAQEVAAVAGSEETVETYVEETAPGEFSGRTYVLTLQQTGATGNGAALNASLEADVSP